MQQRPAELQCAECLRHARALRAAWQADNRALRTKIRDLAAVSGRDLRQVGLKWVFSLAAMPDEEMRVLLDAHYPKVTAARQESEEHETATGHSLKGWWAALQYWPDELE
jgi:hypothetical protein